VSEKLQWGQAQQGERERDAPSALGSDMRRMSEERECEGRFSVTRMPIPKLCWAMVASCDSKQQSQSEGGEGEGGW